MFRRQRKYAPELIAEAKTRPGGYVYEIDPRFDADGFVPMHAVKGAWKVDDRGELTGDYWNNETYGRRAPLTEVGQIVADAQAHAGERQLKVYVAETLTYNGDPVPFDVGITIAMDSVLALGYFPEGDSFRESVDGGYVYTLVKGGRWRLSERRIYLLVGTVPLIRKHAGIHRQEQVN